MVKKGKLMVLVLCLLLTGCKKPEVSSENRFVSSVSVELNQAGVTKVWNFQDEQKMEVVLYYLRSLEREAPAHTDPERFGGNRYFIRLTYTDGTTRRFYQRADRFISEGLGPWKTVDPGKGALLYPLLCNLRSD